MKKIIVYFMICAYFSTFTQVRQLSKIPNLLEHFISHKLQNHDMSLFTFFKVHYLEEQVQDSDYEQDMNLPFKTHDFSNSFITLNIPPEKPTVQIQRPLLYVDSSPNFSYAEKFYPSVLQRIWEPPKI